jgi:hypothetical protein
MKGLQNEYLVSAGRFEVGMLTHQASYYLRVHYYLLLIFLYTE